VADYPGTWRSGPLQRLGLITEILPACALIDSLVGPRDFYHRYTVERRYPADNRASAGNGRSTDTAAATHSKETVGRTTEARDVLILAAPSHDSAKGMSVENHVTRQRLRRRWKALLRGLALTGEGKKEGKFTS